MILTNIMTRLMHKETDRHLKASHKRYIHTLMHMNGMDMDKKELKKGMTDFARHRNRFN